MVRIILLEHADKSLAADDVNAFARSVKKNVVAFTGCAQASNLLTAFRVKDNHHRRLAGDGEESMIRFVQCHGVVATQSLERPFRNGSGFQNEHFSWLPPFRFRREQTAPGKSR